MIAPNAPLNEVLITYGEDAEDQSRSIYIKFWQINNDIKNYETMSNIMVNLAPIKRILVGRMGEAERIISCMHVLPDLSLMVLGTKRGTILVYESKNLMEKDYKMSSKMVEKK